MYLHQIKVKDGVIKEVLHFQRLFFIPHKKMGVLKKKKTLMEFAINMCN